MTGHNRGLKVNAMREIARALRSNVPTTTATRKTSKATLFPLPHVSSRVVKKEKKDIPKRDIPKARAMPNMATLTEKMGFAVNRKRKVSDTARRHLGMTKNEKVRACHCGLHRDPLKHNFTPWMNTSHKEEKMAYLRHRACRGTMC
jgi:hypothetical protein